jgi:hypothetical protein
MLGEGPPGGPEEGGRNLEKDSAAANEAAERVLGNSEAAR